MNFTKSIVAATLCLSMIVAPQQGEAATPVRDGFTLELGLGIAYSHMAFDGGSSLNEVGNSTITLSMGWFLTNDFALMVHTAGAAAYPEFMDERVLITNQFLGVVGQYWLNDRIYLSGGLGAAMWGVSFQDGSGTGTSPDWGFALSARAGYSFANWENHSLRVAVEMIPEFFDSRTVVATALNLEWQWF
ncbi:MAG: hypothetical protein JRH20_20605 [Deltaproteobacteria bacterium]|nr:hypothetical protein [Deltaproteobacteria bacterium]